MARSLGREFATMTADETPAQEAADELDMEDPRDSEPMGSRYATPRDEVADPDAEIAE
jgi:hypothetical protein